MTMVVLYGDYAARQADRLRGLLGDGYEVVPVPYDTPPERIRALLAQTEIIVTNAFGPTDPPVPRLRLLQSPSAGMEEIDAALLPPGCALRTVGGHEIPMSEFVLCAMLDWRIGFRSLTGTVVDGRWSQRDWIKGPVHGEIHGATLGIVGFGRIGREIATRARAFGMEVRALSRWRGERPSADLVSRCFAMDERADFLAPCDFVAITLPLTAETHGLVDSSWFGAMKGDGVLINVARGDVVRQDDLYAALATRRIGGAIIDVWYRYPDSADEKVAMADHPFHTLPNVVVSPHGSGRTHRMFERRWIEIAANIRAATR
jgi:phosphoglycerate dehydrogenase-like enzyme